MPPRDYERVRCPRCGRMVAAYTPLGGDPTGRLKVLAHTRRASRTRTTACPVSDRMIAHGLGGWQLDAS